MAQILYSLPSSTKPAKDAAISGAISGSSDTAWASWPNMANNKMGSKMVSVIVFMVSSIWSSVGSSVGFQISKEIEVFLDTGCST